MDWPPSDQEVAALLVSSKVCKEAPDCSGSVASAVAKMESVTGWRPFVSDDKTVSRRLDPPDDGRLYLPWGFLSVDSVYTGVTDDEEGTLLTRDTYYKLCPGGASYGGDPYETVEGGALTGSVPRSVQVTGVLGRMRKTDPRMAEVRRWVVRGAAASVFFEAKGEDGATKKLKQGPVEVEYADREGLSRIEGWQDGFDAFCARYRRNWI